MKKGFTLIELLAVIVILAVIALIVTPIVTGIIKSAKEQANARSVEGHIKSIENAIILNAFSKAGDMKAFDNKTKTEIEALITAENDHITCASYTILNGTVQRASGCTATGWSGTYTYTIGNGAVVDASVEFNGTYVAPSEGDTHKGIVYMDPKNPEATCTASSTITATNTGCKKFYIFDDSGSNYKMIMDRNLGDNVPWISLDDATKIITDGQYSSLADIPKEDKPRVMEMVYNFDMTTFEPVTLNAQFTIDAAGWIGKPRMITADEIAHIVGADREDTIKWSSTKSWNHGFDIDTSTEIGWYYLDGGRNSNPTIYDENSYGWQKEYATSTRKSIYAWLFDYTYDCTSYGCNINFDSDNPDGYWASTTSIREGYQDPFSYVLSGNVFVVDNIFNDYYGIRPVIAIPKTAISSGIISDVSSNEPGENNNGSGEVDEPGENNNGSGENNNEPVVVETWDTYYTIDSNHSNQTTSTYSDSWPIWGQENTTTGEQQICAKLSQGRICIGNQEWNAEYNSNAKSRLEAAGFTCEYRAHAWDWEGFGERFSCYNDTLSTEINPYSGNSYFGNGSYKCEIQKFYGEAIDVVSSTIECQPQE